MPRAHEQLPMTLRRPLFMPHALFTTHYSIYVVAARTTVEEHTMLRASFMTFGDARKRVQFSPIIAIAPARITFIYVRITRAPI